MPIYEYRCDACGAVFEEWHKQADDIMEQPCPVCAKAAHRQISNTSFVLKGGGWYVTEYGNRKSDGASAPSTKSEADASAAQAPAANADGAGSAKAAPTPAAGEKPATPAAAD